MTDVDKLAQELEHEAETLVDHPERWAALGLDVRLEADVLRSGLTVPHSVHACVLKALADKWIGHRYEYRVLERIAGSAILQILRKKETTDNDVWYNLPQYRND